MGKDICYKCDGEIGLTSFASEIKHFLKLWFNPASAVDPLDFQLDKFCVYMLNLFEKQHCVDIDMIAEILNLVFSIKRSDIDFRIHAKNTPWNHIMRTFRRYNMITLMKIPYIKLNICLSEDPVRFALNVRDNNLLNLLMRYGVAYLPPQPDDQDFQQCLASKGIHKILHFTGYLDEEDECHFKYYVVNQCTHRIFKIYPSSSHHRLYLLIMGIEDIVQEKSVKSGIKCFKTIFQSIPEPHISSSEILNFLSRLLNCMECEPPILKILKVFEQECPENGKLYQPRSLKHLSRCVTRQNLREAGTFPHSVHSLPLPDVLKKYILLMERCEKFNVDWTTQFYSMPLQD